MVYLGLGANLGDRRSSLARALDELGRLLRLDALSSVYRSEPVGYTRQPEFWNMAVRAFTRLQPPALLDVLKALETRLGRTPTFHQGPRLIDIDILLYDDLHVAGAALAIPHPRLLERAFVLRPLLQLDPDLVHPVTGQPLADRLAAGTFERTEPLFPGHELLDAGPP